jgi:hypothetical protein
MGWVDCCLCINNYDNWRIKMIDYVASFVNTDGAAFPDTKALNVTAPGAGDGTEFVKLMIDDIWGRAQALMDYAGLTPDGVSEAAGTAQIIDAIVKGFAVGPGIGVLYLKNDTPVANGDRVLLLNGQVILIANYAELVAATYIGDGNNADTDYTGFFKTSDAGGTTRDTAGTYFVLPDFRGLALKMIGDAVVNGRTKTGPVKLTELQEDQLQGHEHNYRNVAVAGAVAAPTGGATAFGIVKTAGIVTDGVNGTPRTGENTRDSAIGVNYGITY